MLLPFQVSPDIRLYELWLDCFFGCSAAPYIIISVAVALLSRYNRAILSRRQPRTPLWLRLAAVTMIILLSISVAACFVMVIYNAYVCVQALGWRENALYYAPLFTQMLLAVSVVLYISFTLTDRA